MTELPPPWDQFVHVADPGLGQAITLMHPGLSINFYLRGIDFPAVAQLYAEAMKLIESGLTHYIAENMKRPEKITSRALGMIPAWMHKPKEDRYYVWEAHGGEDLGRAAPGFQMSMIARSLRSAQQKAEVVQELLKACGPGEIPRYVWSSSIRLLLPVDHPLGEASAMAEWLLSLELLRRGSFDAIEVSYGLSTWTHLDHGETAGRERAACSRYPGLDAFRAVHSGHVRADAGYPDLIPLVKRAAWTNVLHDLTVQALGGEAVLRKQLADTPEVRVTSFEHGVILQAGERPALGDLNRGDYLPLVRKVAKVIRPVRVEKFVEMEARQDPFWDHFFNIFDKDYTPVH